MNYVNWNGAENINIIVLLQFYWSADIMTSFVTALHILSFAALRLISIRYPHTYSKISRFHQKVCGEGRTCCKIIVATTVQYEFEKLKSSVQMHCENIF